MGITLYIHNATTITPCMSIHDFVRASIMDSIASTIRYDEPIQTLFVIGIVFLMDFCLTAIGSILSRTKILDLIPMLLSIRRGLNSLCTHATTENEQQQHENRSNFSHKPIF